MKKETKSWVLTFGIDNRINAHKRAKMAHLLAIQIVDKMDQTYGELHEYLEIYESIDSTSRILHQAILADTLERVDEKIAESFLVNSPSEYVQVEYDDGLDAYRTEILKVGK